MAIEPVTREERFLAAAGGRSVTPPTPITRKEQLLQGIIDAVKSGGATPDVIENAVNNYLDANPVKPGATTEQAAQIEQNKTDIADLQTEVDELKESGGNGSGQNLYFEPSDGDTPLVFFTGVKPTTKDNVLAEMVYISKSKIIKAYVKIKCQGSSSMNYAKKNFTVTLYQDDARTIPLYLEFKDWGIKVNKFVLKADWIDHSHSRNVCTARIWKDIVESRPDYDTLPEELKNAPGHGAIVGFPIAVYYNGNYEGIYNWNIGKDPWMWSMDEANPNHAMLCAEVNNEGTGNATMCNFQGPLWGGVDGTGWSVEIGTNSTELKNSLNALIQFVSNSDEETFVNGIEEYLDVQSAMDYYCLCYADCGLDGLGKNMTIGTYDGKKWYFGAYDLDCTWLLYWNGSKFVPATYRCPEDYQENANLLFDKFERYMTTRLRTNYKRLRSGPLSASNIMQHFERYIGSIGSERYEDDLVAYPAIPQGNTNNIRQIRAAVRDRLAYTDAEFAAMTESVPCTGITLSAETLTFTATGTQTLTATVTPDGCTDPVTWESDNTSVATVSGGVVTAIANGSATITAKCGEYSVSCAVAVSGIAEPVPCTGISLDKSELTFTEAGTQTLTATVTPEDTTDAVTWESSNANVATVENGTVMAIANGSATITARCGNQSAECAVAVSGIATPYPLENGIATMGKHTVEISNGNHVKLTYPDGVWEQSYLPLSHISRIDGGTINNERNTAYSSEMFTLNAGDTVRLVKRNTNVTVTSGEDQTSVYSSMYLSHDSGSAKDITKGNLFADADGSITIVTNCSVDGLCLWTQQFNGKIVEFDVEMYVNGVRYI